MTCSDVMQRGGFRSRPRRPSLFVARGPGGQHFESLFDYMEQRSSKERAGRPVSLFACALPRRQRGSFSRRKGTAGAPRSTPPHIPPTPTFRPPIDMFFLPLTHCARLAARSRRAIISPTRKHRTPTGPRDDYRLVNGRRRL